MENELDSSIYTVTAREQKFYVLDYNFPQNLMLCKVRVTRTVSNFVQFANRPPFSKFQFFS